MILVPFDGSGASAHALDYACDFAKLLGTEIHVCQAIDYVSLPGTRSKSPETAICFAETSPARFYGSASIHAPISSSWGLTAAPAFAGSFWAASPRP